MRDIAPESGLGTTHFDSLASTARASADEDDSATEDALRAALAATLDGVETDDIAGGECTDARRRLSASTAETRRLQSSSVSVEFTITVQAAVLGATTGNDAADEIGQTLSDAVESGALSSNIASELEDAGIETSISATSVSAVRITQPPTPTPTSAPSSGDDDDVTKAELILAVIIGVVAGTVGLVCLVIICVACKLGKDARNRSASAANQVVPTMAMATAVPMVDPGTGVQLVQLPPQAIHQQPVLLPAPGMQPQPLQVVQLRPGNAEVTQVAQVVKSVPI